MAERSRLRTSIHIAVFAALIAVCAQIIIPAAIPFTMQTFGIFFAAACLGGKNGLLAFLVYLGLGIVGIPVFSGFGSGIGILFGPTGGYLLGYLAADLFLWSIEKRWKKGHFQLIVSLIAAQILCYACGTIWYMFIYAARSHISLLSALSTCVLPFILPDLAKILMIYPIKKQFDKARLFH